MSKERISAPESLSIWKANMEALASRQPMLAQYLASYIGRQGSRFEHYESKTPAGRWVEGLTPEPFFESDDRSAIGWSASSREAPIFFLHGVGTPDYLLDAIKALPREALSLIVVEPTPALLVYALRTVNAYAAMPEGAALTFVTVPDAPLVSKKTDVERKNALNDLSVELREEALMTGINPYGVYTVTMALITEHRGEKEACSSLFLGVAKDIKEWVMLRLTTIGNSVGDTLLGLRQMALMSPWISYGYQFTKLLDKYKGRPFIIVSAGPSLDKNFELLREIQDKCIIIATDAVLGKMIKSGILPHIVCALERGLPTYNALFAESLQKFPDACAKILLIAQAVCTPKIYGRWPGPKMIVGKAELPMDQWFVVNTIGGEAITSGSSVAHMNYALAIMMGASSIAFIGQDLAYADDGTSHAGGIFSDNLLKAQNKNVVKRKVYRVPGIYGGVVETSEVWFLFLRALESLVRTSSVPTYDCTEGGAVIQGTIVQAFSDYRERNILHLPPLPITPCNVALTEGIVADRRKRFEILQPRLQAACNDMVEAEEILSKMLELLVRVRDEEDAKKRLALATDVSGLLDGLHTKNQMFAFVTQSYVYESSVEIMKNRFLDTPEAVERWVAVHEDIAEAHGATVSFVRTWLGYTDAALRYYLDCELPLVPFPKAELLEHFKRVCKEMGDGHDQIALRMEMDAIFASADMIRLGWPPEYMWQCAMFLQREGRSQEATALMNRAAQLFENKELPTEEIASFFKDYARVLASPDLCHVPDYHRAELMLDNAVDLEGGSEETHELRRNILSRSVALYANLAVLGGTLRANRVKWIAARAAASEALSAGDPVRAMQLTWEAICDYGVSLPSLAGPQLDWLVRNLEKFFGAEQEPYKSAVDKLLTGMASRVDVLSVLPARYSANFKEVLKARYDSLMAEKTAVVCKADV